jgi:Zn-finger nucleic acid-binding protein
MMNCPVDGSALQENRIGHVAVHECPQCNGMWFDEGELEKARDEANPNLSWMDFNLWKSPQKYQVSVHHLTCPRDQRAMAMVVDEHSGIGVDICLECHGIWLESGEFQRILDALENEMASMPEGEYLRDSLREAGELLRSPGQFVSQWQHFTTVLRLMEFRVLSRNPRLRDTLMVLAATTPFK